MIKAGDLYRGKYPVLIANEYLFVIDNLPPYDMSEYNIVTQDTFLVKWRYETVKEAVTAFDELTAAFEKELENILLIN
jgi:hypothetical protein